MLYIGPYDIGILQATKTTANATALFFELYGECPDIVTFGQLCCFDAN